MYPVIPVYRRQNCRHGDMYPCIRIQVARPGHVSGVNASLKGMRPMILVVLIELP